MFVEILPDLNILHDKARNTKLLLGYTTNVHHNLVEGSLLFGILRRSNSTASTVDNVCPTW